MHQTKISTKSDEDGFSSAVFRLRLEQKKFPLLNVYFDAFVFCFLRRNLCSEWVTVFGSVAIIFYSFALSAAKVPPGQ